MRRRLPTVRDGSLHERAVEGTSHNVIPVGSEQWVLWVEQHRSFRCETISGAFTVRKEQRSGGWYWYVYRRRHGKVQTAYLGKSAELTLQRLNAVTTRLARGDSAPSQPVFEDDSSQDHPASGIPQLARLEQMAHELTLAQQTQGQHEWTGRAPGPPTSLSGGGISRTTAGGEPVPATVQQPPEPLVLTKVQAPRLRSALVHRFRLAQRLQGGMEGPLTLLSAPAGFGKTTLLTSWLASSGTPVAWFSVEPEDNDPVRFFTYVIAALQRLDASLGTRVLPLLQSRGPAPAPLDTVLALLINDLSTHEEGRLVLVLDDYHIITTQSIHRAIVYLVEHLPSQMHLVIAARADPPLHSHDGGHEGNSASCVRLACASSWRKLTSFCARSWESISRCRRARSCTTARKAGLLASSWLPSPYKGVQISARFSRPSLATIALSWITSLKRCWLSSPQDPIVSALHLNS